MEKVDTDTLRSAAPKWSLGGDKRLLDTLQNMHQKIVTKCTETNTKLNILINKLDTASIDLQNVNNKFMGLSNTQFIERRVYDDDVDIAPPVEPPKETPKVIEPSEEMVKLKKAIQIFESMHEMVQILDSDSSDDEDEVSLVLKPKDVYSNRPLPYIIGSEPWRTKWHAGLVVEDSDADSAGSKNEPREEYSDSEPEVTDIQSDKHTAKDEWVSKSTSVEASVSTPSTKPAKPADIAAELARRLGGDTIPPPPPMETVPEPITNKVYRPEQPVAATIFSNDPPPLDQVESDSEDDIFAELHRNRCTQNAINQPVSSVVDELFGNSESIKPPNNNDKTNLFDDDSESELFVEKPKTKERSPKPIEEKSDFKKPVGGISLFGSNKNSISIGAAILKRQQPKSSDEESDSPESPDITRNKISSNIPDITTENYKVSVNDNNVANQQTINSVQNSKNIIENIFAKPTVKKNINLEQETEKEVAKKKIDLFSDDLFDDIDDIFTSKITKKPDTKQKDSLFDSDDDLFSDNIMSKSSLNQVNKKLVMSDSDDGLFKEIVPKKSIEDKPNDELLNRESNAKVNDEENSPTIKKKVIKTPSIIDVVGVNVDHHDIFSDNNISKSTISTQKFSEQLINSIESKETTEKILGSKNETIMNIEKYKTTSSNVNDFKSILDDESDDELFKSNSLSNKANKSSIKSTIFNDESEEELFGKTNLNIKTIKSNQNINITNIIESGTKNVGVTKKEIKNDTTCDEASPEIVASHVKTKNIFDDDSDEELFSDKNRGFTEELINKSSTGFEKVKVPVVSTEERYTVPKNINAPTVIENNSVSNQQITENKEKLCSTKNLKFYSPLVFNDDEINQLNKPITSLENTENMSYIKKNREVDTIASEKYTNLHSNQNITLQDEKIFVEIPQPFNLANEDKKLHVENDTLKESHILVIEGNRSNISTEPDVTEIEPSVPEKLKESSPFSDIFNDIPPEFEKPKEPKRSKNVNALFDDDSDDETLFFKKSSDIADEEPNPSCINERFSIFHDEPPDIEVDFTSKQLKTYKNDIQDQETIRNTTEPNVLNTEIITSEPILNADEVKISNPNIDIKTNFSANPNADDIEQSLESSIRSTNAMITDKINKLRIDIKKTNEDDTKTKNIGKLKPMNFNINVNTLLPGVTHRKQKLLEEIDGTTSSKVVSNESEEKTINFKEEAAILDNKLSKERAKIQVKRRPSTRRARKEAARKSGIDFGNSNDSTDNSCSIDELKKENQTKNTLEHANVANEIKNNNVANKGTENVKSTTKLVYILNDEDIFTNDNKNLETDLGSQADTKLQKSQGIDNPSSSTKNKDKNQNSIDKKSIFDLSDSETELFGAKETKVTSKDKLFDSNSDDDDLFASKKKIITKQKKETPLFSDESDEELFRPKINSDMQVSKENIHSEPVFEDPLSILNQDDS